MEYRDFSADFSRFVVTIIFHEGKLIVYSMLSFTHLIYNFTIFIGRAVEMLSFADYLFELRVRGVHLRFDLKDQASST